MYMHLWYHNREPAGLKCARNVLYSRSLDLRGMQAVFNVPRRSIEPHCVIITILTHANAPYEHVVAHANVFWRSLSPRGRAAPRRAVALAAPTNDVAFIRPDDLKNLKDPPFFESLAL